MDFFDSIESGWSINKILASQGQQSEQIQYYYDKNIKKKKI